MFCGKAHRPQRPRLPGESRQVHRADRNWVVIYSTACDITDAANEIAAEGGPVDPDDLTTIALYITHTIRRLRQLDPQPPYPNRHRPPGWT
jgi:hypothetical protein